MSYTFTVKDFSDIETIVTIFSSFYLNSGIRNRTAMFDRMMTQPRNVVYNFTILCINWFQALSKVNYYDDRNEASVMIARKMADSYKFLGLTYRVHKKIPKKTMIVDGKSHTDVADMLACFLKVNQTDRYGKTPQDDFLEKMLHEHKTIQQMFSRLCFDWFDYLLQHQGDSKGTHFRLARQAAAFRKPLPYI